MGGQKRQMSRFVIPFSFPLECYDRLSDGVEKQRESTRKGQGAPLWKRQQFHDNENEFFPFFKDSLNLQDAHSIGALWELVGKNDERLRGKLFYHLKGGTEQEGWVRCDISGAGLALFKTGVGLAWFELSLALWSKFPSDQDAEDLTPRQVIEVNNYCKDICHRNLSSGRKPFRFFPDKAYLGEEPPAGIPPYREFSMFPWLWQFFFAPMVGMISGDIRFFSRRRQKSGDGQTPETGPDKAHIYTALYLAKPLAPEEEKHALYWLRRGYQESYLPSDRDLEGERLQVFENFTCAACFEGCAFLAYETGKVGTDRVFGEHLMTSMLRAYFVLYLMSLHQYYTILKLSAELAQLPGQAEAFGPREFQQLLCLREELGLAYTKAFFPQASYVGHQNTVYEHFKQGLQIDRLQAELSQKANVLTELIQDYRARRQERYGRTLTVIGGIFVVIQTLNNVLGIYDMAPVPAALGRWGFGALAMGAACLLGVILAKPWKKEKKR